MLAIQSLAKTYKKLGDNDKAIAAYKSWIKCIEDSGLAAASQGRMVEIHETIVALDPRDTDARKFLAGAYKNKEHSEKAIT
ncbi:MAG TPA: hypothetical protein EYQ31_02405, partial [Candidatus Handelsmanbacteria bacterium]|nr:hypothetical protein [Candidatus Handelsmanbacteria bacterium]